MLPWIVVGGMIYAMRRLERWLHQHIFKVGWLLTKNLRTTTILYYTFFLPGVILHEVVYWFVAGVLNVRAESVFKYPEAQSIAELKLNFVRLPRNVGQVKLAIISTAPLVVGIIAVYLIANTVLNLNQAVEVLARPGGVFANLGDAVGVVLATPDVWLWAYIAFTIANTMTPSSWQALKGWRVIAVALVIAVLVLFFLGIADDVFWNALAQPLQTGVNLLSLTIAAIIVIDLLMTGVLGIIEAIIERITGDSATFNNGKLEAKTRKQILEQREQERLRHQRQLEAAKKREARPHSIYEMALEIPSSSGKGIDYDSISVTREEQLVLFEPEPRSQPESAETTAAPVLLVQPQPADSVHDHEDDDADSEVDETDETDDVDEAEPDEEVEEEEPL